MIWADRAGLAIAALIALCSLCLAAVLFIGVGTLADVRLATTIALWSGIAEMTIAVPLWVVLRLGDLLFGGPRRRRRHERGRERVAPDLRDVSLIPLESVRGD